MENKHQEALNKIVQSICPTHKNCQECNFEKACNSEAKEWVDTLQELIDICSQPNSIKYKLDLIQDVIDSCYETDEKGNLIKSEFNDDIDLADEYLQDIKKAYSFRVEDTRIVNELQELLGNCCVDYIKKKVQELIDNKEIIEIQNSNLDDEIQMYKKALKNACRLAIRNNHSSSYIAIYEGTREQYNLPLTFDDLFNEKILNDYLLEQARKEIENGKNN